MDSFGYGDDIDEDTPLCMKAIGPSTGGDGSGGLAQLLTNRSRIGKSHVYFFLGYLGASTIVAKTDISDESTLVDTLNDILLVAGGSGSDTTYDNDDYSGGGGGSGAVVTSSGGNSESCMFASGSDGVGRGNYYAGSGGGPKNDGEDDTVTDDDCIYFSREALDYALGGSSGGKIDGDSADIDGVDGLGGLGGDPDSTWYNVTDITLSWYDSNAIDTGDGGTSTSSKFHGAYGGGGAGGGGGGYEESGGGGGSAITNKSIDDTFCEDDIYTDAVAGDDSYDLFSSKYGTVIFMYDPY